ncbi:hypothetical protein AOQ71_23270 [Bradyrhizobium manausense]|uniref:Uncharacterized protein n=2 Tax=Bradyrhizobium manausense TaxID=989370 RepID=A0A0R3DBL6_9BRAD|nr:hypothetical protein AOQ71_23270 [Bradyrhizobium manausense]
MIVAVVTLTPCLVALEYLHATGFCYRDARYLTDEELIRVAADEAVRTNRAYEAIEQRIEYASATDLIARNPDCCVAIKDESEQSDDPILRDIAPDRVFGPYVLAIEVIYRAKQDGPKPFDHHTYYLGACGERLDYSGSAEAHGRLPRGR